MVLTNKEQPGYREDREVASDRFLHTIYSSPEKNQDGVLCVIKAKRTIVKSIQRYPTPEHFFYIRTTPSSAARKETMANQKKANSSTLDEFVMCSSDAKLIEIVRDLVFISKQLQREHAELKKFIVGFKKSPPCDCIACVKARRIIP